MSDTMLPTRAYTEAIPRLSPGGPTPRPAGDTHPALVVVAAPGEIDRFAAANFTRYPVHSTADAVRMIEMARPRAVAIDWDAPSIEGAEVCAAARKFPHTGILVTLADPAHAASVLKAGCHAILLKPFAPNLVAGRLGRLSREMPTTPTAARAAAALQQSGTNRVWPQTHCPRCNAGSATSFEFSSYRRMWYACLACDAVWLGARQE